MNLNNLKPAWQQFRLFNSMRVMDQEEILMIIEKADGMAINKTTRLMTHTFLFLILTFCCQGG